MGQKIHAALRYLEIEPHDAVGLGVLTPGLQAAGEGGMRRRTMSVSSASDLSHSAASLLVEVGVRPPRVSEPGLINAAGRSARPPQVTEACKAAAVDSEVRAYIRMLCMRGDLGRWAVHRFPPRPRSSA